MVQAIGRGDGDVFLKREAGEETRPPILGDIADAFRCEGALGRLAVDAHLAPRARLEAVDDSAELGTAGADEPGHAQDLAAMHLQAQTPQPLRADVVDLEHDCGRRGGRTRAGGSDRPARPRRAAGNEPAKIVARKRRQGAAERFPAVAQHRHGVGRFVNLVQPVGHVDDRQTALFESDEPGDELQGFRLRQARGRLIEHEDAARMVEMVERARDRDQGSIDRPEMSDAFMRRGFDADAFKLAPHALFLPFPADAADGVAHIAALEREVVDDGKIGDESEILVDEAEARGPSLLREPVGVQRLAVNRHDAGVEQMVAGERADQRRLARSVGAEQRRDASPRDAKTHVVERERGAEALRRSGHHQCCRLFVRHRLPN